MASIFRKLKVSVGIPAYNEAGNIGALLAIISTQIRDNFELVEVIVNSDGSTDSTVEIAKGVDLPEVLVWDNKERKGKSFRQQEIFRHFSSDVLVMLDADILPTDNMFLSRIVIPFTEDSQKLGLVSCPLVPLPALTHVEKVLNFSVKLKEDLLLSNKSAHNIYACHGPVRVFSRELVAASTVGSMVSDDAYSYLLCLEQGLKFKYVTQTFVLFRSPQTVKDYIAQSVRFNLGQKELGRYIDKDIIKSAHAISWILKFKVAVKALLTNPILFVEYLFLLSLARLHTFLKKEQQTIWDVAVTSKKLSSHKRVIYSNYDDLNNPYYAGGGAMAVHEVAKRLSLIYDVLVITGKYPGSINERIDNVGYRRIGIGFAGPFIGQLSYFFLLPLYVLRESFDVWIESFTPPFSTACLQLFTRKPVVGITHSLGGQIMSKKYHFPFWVFEALGLKTYRYCITFSAQLRDVILKINKKIQVEIIPNGLNGELLDLHVEHFDKHILYLGRIDMYQKGLDILLEAYSAVRHGLGYKLIIAGDGAKGDIEKLESMIQKLDLTDSVLRVGRVDGDYKRELLNNAIFVVMPSRTEAFPLTALEAMAFRCPLIVTNIVGFGWIPDDSCLKVASENIGELSDAMQGLAIDSALRGAKSENAHKFVQQFNWDRIGDMFTNFISGIWKEKK